MAVPYLEMPTISRGGGECDKHLGAPYEVGCLGAVFEYGSTRVFCGSERAVVPVGKGVSTRRIGFYCRGTIAVVHLLLGDGGTASIGKSARSHRVGHVAYGVL